MYSRKGIIPAYKFRKDSSGDDFLMDYVNTNLALVEDDIIKAVHEQRRECCTEIPDTYQIPYLDFDIARDKVFYHTIQALKQSEYTVRLEHRTSKGKTRIYLHVTWMNQEDLKQEKYIEEFLLAHSIRTVDKRTKKKRKKKK